MRTGRPIKYPELTKEQLYDLYWNEELNIPQIATRLGIPKNSVQWYFIRLKIPTRTCSQARGVSIKRGDRTGVQLTLSKKELYDLYWNQGLTLDDIAEQVGCSQMLVKKKMAKLGIDRRSVSDAAKLAFQNGRKGDGRFQDSRDGYVYILKPEHHRADNRGYIREHILVWEEVNRKPLPKGWVVHHLNGIKGDNRPENLLGMYHRDHNSQLQLETLRQRIRYLEEKLASTEGQTKLGY